MKKYIVLFLILALSGIRGLSQANYDEAKVPDYTLPDPLVTFSGEPVRQEQSWSEDRRKELLDWFGRNEYGILPPGADVEVNFRVRKQVHGWLEGKADMKEVTCTATGNGMSRSFTLLLVTPADTGPVPVFLGYNFRGNHTIHPDTAITIHHAWVGPMSRWNITDTMADARSRGYSAQRWPVDLVLEKGFGIATAYYGELDPDYDDGFGNGFHPLFYKEGQQAPDSCEFGSIALWAWGLSRMLDYLETDPDVRGDQVAVIGHSRLGKTALWAAARDPRFAAAISNNSGCGGAALSKRKYGETVAAINERFPHWFCDRFNRYNNREEDLPVDQHLLLSLIYPRPLYVASASEDRWSDPRGEFLSLQAASAVWNQFGKPVQFPGKMPGAEQPFHTILGYHLREGVHDITPYDWEQYTIWFGLQLNRTEGFTAPGEGW